MPFANWKGASAGMIASHVIILFVTFGHLTIDKSDEFLETSIAGCTNESFSSAIVKPTSPMFISLAQQKPIAATSWLERNVVVSTTQAGPVQDNSQFPQNVFSISYMYYSLFGTLITVFVGMFVSLLTRSDADAYDSKYIHPCVYRMAKWFPGYEKLFSIEQSDESSNIKTSSLKAEPVEQHYNQAFDTHSENICSSKEKSREVAFKHDEDEICSVKFKSNIIYKSELEPRTENYKKLSEDTNVN